MPRAPKQCAGGCGTRITGTRSRCDNCTQPRTTNGPRTNTSWSGQRRSFPTAMRRRILNRDPICKACGTEPSTIADHVLNHATCLRLGINPDTEDNGQGLCDDCHRVKTRVEQQAGTALRTRGTQGGTPSPPT